MAPDGGRASRDNTNLIYQERCGGDALKFIFEEADEVASATLMTIPLSADRKNWVVKGANADFSAAVDTPEEARQIKTYQRSSAQCMAFSHMFNGPRRRHRRRVRRCR